MRAIVPVLLLLLSSPLLAWTTNGPHGGPAYELETSGSTIYLATAGGLFRSDDGGASWSDRGMPGISVVAADPVDADVVYVAARGGALHKTTDGGRTWKALTAGLPAGFRTTQIVIDPADHNTLYAGAHCGLIFKIGVEWHESAGLFKSTDAGETWMPASSGLQGFALCVEELSLDPSASGHLFVTAIFSEGGQHFSTNGGATWTRSSTGVPGSAIVIDPRTGFRYGITNRLRSRFFSSTDGINWTRTAATGVSGVYQSLTVDPATGRLFLGTDAGIFRSGDGGNVWAPIANAPEHVRTVLYDSATNTLLVGTLTGLFRANWMAGQFTRIDVPDHAVSVQQLALDPRDPSIVYTATWDWFNSSTDSHGRVFRSTDAGGSWTTIHEGAMRNRLAVDARGDLYAGAQFWAQNFYRFRDGTWEPLPWQFSDVRKLVAHPTRPGEVRALEPSGVRVGGNGIAQVPITNPNDMDIARDGSVFYIAADSGFARSTDGILFVLTDDAVAKRVAVAPSDAATAYRILYTLTPGQQQFWTIQRTANRGSSWAARTNPAAPNEELSDVAVEPDDPSRVWLSTSTGRVFRSFDGGLTWTDERDDLPAVAIYSIEIGGNVVHLATSAGAWETRLNPRRRAVR
ncbi:MAG TPA: hypothetical protein VGF69_14685 [Thermoanaerobaculia bacterium]|jgi:photosystem II stability/assembly factor-like uncharacterized protein